MFTLEPPVSLLSHEMIHRDQQCRGLSEVQCRGLYEVSSGVEEELTPKIIILSSSRKKTPVDKEKSRILQQEGKSCKKMKNKVPANFDPKQKEDLQSYNVSALKKFGENLGLDFSDRKKRNEVENAIMRHFFLI